MFKKKSIYNSIYNYKHDSWLVHFASEADYVKANIQTLLDLQLLSGVKFRDFHRNMVKLVEFEDSKLVLKQPRSKNRNTWIRVLTWFRKSEVVRALHAINIMREAGIDTVTPLMALEKRRWGMVVDSWLYYFYRPGKRSSRTEYPMIVATLKQIHGAGYLHCDPNLDNFLFDGKTVFVIDCKMQQRPFIQFWQQVEWLRFAKGRTIEDELIELFPIKQRSTAQFYMHFFLLYKKLRKRMKNWLRLGTSKRLGSNL